MAGFIHGRPWQAQILPAIGLRMPLVRLHHHTFVRVPARAVNQHEGNVGVNGIRETHEHDLDRFHTPMNNTGLSACWSLLSASCALIGMCHTLAPHAPTATPSCAVE
ncbi:hypothetical protein [Malikia spinosa]|uniref:hypothetical protein n=1 Tax=Malikia spinosa TaxID=86180 RepID=UPI001475E94B|nr:hypothetical protein [Malikia spinosa]